MLKRWQKGQPPDAVAQSWKAQHRLHTVLKRLAFRKNSQIEVVARTRVLGQVRVGADAGEHQGSKQGG